MGTIRHSPQAYTGKNKLSLHFSRHRFIMFTLYIHPAVLGKLPLCDSRGLSKPQVSPRPAGAMWGGGGGGVRVCALPSLPVPSSWSAAPGAKGGQTPWSCCPSPWSGEGTPHSSLSSSQPGVGWDLQPESICFLKPFLSGNKGTFGNKAHGAQPQTSPEAERPEPGGSRQ